MSDGVAVPAWLFVLMAALAVWALFYLPQSPSFAVLRMKQAIDASEFNAYAPPLGFESLRSAIVADLGVPGMAARGSTAIAPARVSIPIAPSCRTATSRRSERSPRCRGR